jgi:hypothetical protein
MKRPHWFAISALTVAIAGLLLAPVFVARHQHNVALLERLAPQIERASALAPETKEAILQLLDRVRDAPADQRSEARRALAIERVATALEAKGGSQELSSVGRRSD